MWTDRVSNPKPLARTCTCKSDALPTSQRGLALTALSPCNICSWFFGREVVAWGEGSVVKQQKIPLLC